MYTYMTFIIFLFTDVSESNSFIKPTDVSA